MRDQDVRAIEAIEHAARRLHDLSIAGPAELPEPASTFRVIGKLLDMRENAPHESAGCNWILSAM